MGYGTSSEVRIHGLRELQRDLLKVNRGAAMAVRDHLKVAADPVRERAESLARSNIRNIGDAWSQMRIGTRTASVYIAPQKRRRGGTPRPNLGRLLMTKALIPALEQSTVLLEHEVERAMDHLLDRHDL